MLTQQERIVLLSLVCILFVGHALNYTTKRYPQLNNIVNFIDRKDVYYRVDINKASKEELMRVPYIGEYTAEKIVEYRLRHGHFVSLHQLKDIKGIHRKNFEKFLPYLRALR